MVTTAPQPMAVTEAKGVLASATPNQRNGLKRVVARYQPPDALPWAKMAGPLAAAEDSLARLDERLRASPIRDGWIARTHFADALASLSLDGELVWLEDLVLHDAEMDVRAPTHALTRAHAVLRARRRIAGASPGWAFSPQGLAALSGRSPGKGLEGEGRAVATDEDAVRERTEGGGDRRDERLAAALAAVDAAVVSVHRTLARERPHAGDLDRDEDVRLDEWRSIVEQTRALPPTLAAAIAADAWDALAPLPQVSWCGRLLAAALVRVRAKTRWHMPCLNEVLRAIPRERRRPRDVAARLIVQLDALAAASEAGLKDHDRWLTARALLARKLDGRRSTSKLPALLDYVLTRPIVSAGMIAQELRITPRAAQDLVAELGLRETTGRGRYRAWGVL
jgi:Protein of unknown function (DUF1612)/HTH DNA binding domain